MSTDAAGGKTLPGFETGPLLKKLKFFPPFAKIALWPQSEIPAKELSNSARPIQ
jgi:hypothetical protein